MHTVSESDQAARRISEHTPKNVRSEGCLNIMLRPAQVHKIAL